jgi:hypothetical protein
LIGTEWKFFLSRDEKGLIVERLHHYRSRLLNGNRGQNALL